MLWLVSMAIANIFLATPSFELLERRAIEKVYDDYWSW